MRTLLLAALTLASFCAPAQDWQRVAAPFVAHWPDDHGAHTQFQTEWWYTTGNLVADDGARFGFQVTQFRHGIDPPAPAEGRSAWRIEQVYAAHLAVADLGAQRFVHAERVRRGGVLLAHARPKELDVWLDDWSLARHAEGAREELRLQASDRESALGLTLTLVPLRAPLLHGTDGISSKGALAGNATVYMSWTRLSVEGTLDIGGVHRHVRGEAWFDHEWGTSQLGAGVVGWDWFGLRFEDGRELMLYRLRAADGSLVPQSLATLIEKDGRATTLRAEEVVLETLARWESPHSKASYPARWKLSVPGHALECTLESELPDCEFDARHSSGVIYWEGPVRVSGSTKGEGYGELVGYAGSLAGRF